MDAGLFQNGKLAKEAIGVSGTLDFRPRFPDAGLPESGGRVGGPFDGSGANPHKHKVFLLAQIPAR